MPHYYIPYDAKSSLLVWLLLACIFGTYTAQAQCNRQSDSLELVKLYNATGGANWTNKWDLTKPMSGWYGVRLDKQGCVEYVGLAQNNLNGNLPSLSLQGLFHLFLQNNQLGSIPTLDLPKLQSFSLFGCELGGSIPNFNFPDLKYLNLLGNELTGSIPNFSSRNLQEIYLDRNNLSGTIPNFSLPELVVLDLDQNRLEGEVPDFDLPKLAVLQISDNLLTGMAKFTKLTNIGTRLGVKDSLLLFKNKFSFDDIISNIELINNMQGRSRYTPQNNFYQDTSFQATAGSALTIDLGIDPSIDDNVYTWNKNGKLHTTITGSNKLSFSAINLSDAGVYEVQVSNPRVPKLTLKSKTINIVVTENNSCRYQDSLELVKLYNATDGPNWINKWDLTKPMSGWYGVTLSAQGCVTCVDLDGNTDCATNNISNTGNSLKGKLPNLKLANILYLFLSGNKLNDTIPDFDLSSLQILDLSENELSGKLPSFPKLSKLTYLNLATNKLTGSIPILLPQSLQILYLQDNSFTGGVPNLNLPKLVRLYLNDNKLDGVISELNLQELEYLFLYKNLLNGNIPTFQLPKLKHLYLNYNNLDGTIPDFNMPFLESLFLNNNNLNGAIPNFNALTKLKILALNHNQLSGNVPNVNLSELTILRLSKNLLTGNIPNYQLPKLLELAIDSNKLSGNIPNFQLNNLVTLKLQSCALEGAIPNFSLPKLEVLLLFNNKLSGVIPEFNLPNLKKLYLNINNLEGPVPNFNMPYLEDLFLSFNGLSGAVPPFQMQNLLILDLRKNKLSGSFPNVNFPKLLIFRLNNNAFKSLPEFTKFDSLGSRLLKTDSLYWYSNQLSFESFIPNMGLINKMQGKYRYSPQDSIYRDTTFRLPIGSKLTIDLGIDAGITDNSYAWTQNGKAYPSTPGSNKLVFTNLNRTQAGEYQVKVTNQRVPGLTLNSRKITIIVTDTSACRYKDSLELVKLYNATDGPNWTNKWDLKKPMSGWYGVRLSTQGCVVYLDLSSNQLAGFIPNINLSSLQRLYLYNNKLAGKIPAFNLPSLVFLQLQSNKLSGQIPNLSLKKLQHLYLHDNELEGSIPQLDLPELTLLLLTGNKFSGSIPVPSSTKLERMLLDSNQFSGNIPNLNYPNLKILNLGSNQLEGEIPNFNLPRLRELKLFDNKLSGPIPNFKLDSLTSLFLNQNQLSGTIPNFNLPSLLSLGLFGNNLTGVIPDFSNMPKLQYIHLYNNQLSGSIPNFNLPDLRFLYLHTNRLSGKIPALKLQALEYLYLADNLLSGPIPTITAPNMQRLYLDGNQLEGAIPNLPFNVLQILGLSRNKFTGTVPNFNFPNLTHLQLNNNQLDGLPSFLPLLTSLGSTTNPKDSFNLKRNKFTFDDIINNLDLINKFKGKAPYTPQDSIYRDTTFRLPIGSKLTIDLGIDAGITDNSYAWTQNGKAYPSTPGSNKLVFTNLNRTQAGEYRVKVTNQRVPGLTLNSRKITIIVTDTSACRYKDSLEMVKLYNATNGPNWKNKWDLSKPMGGWYGVALSGQGCVTKINLDSNRLQGNLVDFNLPTLQDLRISFNKELIGSIPSFSRLGNLGYLALASNKLSGSIPNFSLQKLKYLFLYGNELNGNIPNFALPNLNWLYLYENKLTGSIPDFKMRYLTNLHLYTNDLSGSIPRFDSTSLVDLRLAGCGLTGSIPDFNLPTLERLILNGNKLSGTVPNFKSCQKFKLLQLSSNLLEGEIPNFDLPELFYLSLAYNQFIGSVPDFNLPKLQTIYLHYNKLNGQLASFTYSKDLVYIDAQHNKLNGKIPAFNLQKLRNLRINDNDFSGALPNLDLPSLIDLRISNNELSELPALTKLLSIGSTIDSSTLFYVYGNQFSFDDIITNSGITDKFKDKSSYTPQDSIYRDTTIRITSGSPLTIDLGIDPGINDNMYAWTRNGQAYGSPIMGSNKLSFAAIKVGDAGVYRVKVTNQQAQALTLNSRKITLIVTDTSACRYKDSLELVKLYNATDGPNWKNKWDLSKPMSGWYGVRLNAQGCVTCVDLDGKVDCDWDTLNIGNGLKGILPNLTLNSIQQLLLSGNKLSGDIPTFNLSTLLQLGLSNNQFNGIIPNFQLAKLTNLLLFSNQLKGNIPDFNGMPALIYLGLWKNQLEGVIPDFTNLRKLKYLFLHENKLTGSIPYFNALDSLRRLHLNDNTLSGNIPNFKSSTKLEYIYLSNNQLTGSIPDFNALVSLQRIYLSGNQLEGSVPDFNLPKLWFLYLNDNKLDSTIAPLDKTALELIQLQNNQLVGSIPDFTALSTTLRLLWLDNNKLSGNVPNFNLPELTYLGFAYNSLDGSIPDFDLPKLKHLSFARNNFSGKLPAFSKLTNLGTLYGQGNMLSGTIPNFVFPNLSYLDLSNNQFEGNVPNFDFPALAGLDLEDNKLNSLPDLDKLASMGKTNDQFAVFYINRNRFTFKDILPNLDLIAKMQGKSSYAPQDSIYRDTSIRITSGSPLSIDLGIDPGTNSNIYTWTKNGAAYRTINGSNKLTFAAIKVGDAGVYRVKVTNNQAPALTLNSRKITIIVTDTSACRYKDSLELVKLYNATDGPNWKNKWDLTKPMSGWYGVTLSGQGCVTCVDLDGLVDCDYQIDPTVGNGLKGSLPNLKLQNLVYLCLGKNQLSGNIPSFKMSNLWLLDLSYNQFSGNVPNFNRLDLPKLTILFLWSNQLEGAVPDFDLPTLSQLYLGFNKLSGSIPSFSSTSKLKRLDLQNNELTGTIPHFNLNLLQYLYLGKNKLTGTIPNFSFNDLYTFDLSNNQLDGEVPNLNFPNLLALRLSYNQLTNLPKLSQLSAIGSVVRQADTLRLHNNKFTFEDILPNMTLIGKMNGRHRYTPQDSIYRDTTFSRIAGTPLTIDLGIDAGTTSNIYTWTKNGAAYRTIEGSNKLNFPALSLSDNGTYRVQVTNFQVPGLTLYGRAIKVQVNIDTNACRYKDSLELVKLYNATDGPNWKNKWDLTKPMSGWYGVRLNATGCVICIDLDGVVDCDYLIDPTSGNGLKGTLPNLQLQNLNELYLGRNQLSGTIPNFKMPNLVYLNLSYNQFSGNVPNLNGIDLPNLAVLYLSANKLAGVIPDFKLPKLVHLHLSSNSLVGSIPNFSGVSLLKELVLSNNKLTGSIPNFNLPQMDYLYLNKNLLSGRIPDLNNLNKLRFLNLTRNQLSGSVPDFNMPDLFYLQIDSNLLSSLPVFGNLQSIGSRNNDPSSKLLLNNNKFTFKDLALNKMFIDKMNGNHRYTPQDSIYRDTSISLQTGAQLSIDLGIDPDVLNNSYQWYKDGQLWGNPINSNKLVISSLKVSDAGAYRVEVKNPDAPDLTLYSRTIRLSVKCGPPNPNAKITSTAPKDTVCKDTKLTLSASGGSTYKWSSNSASSASIDVTLTSTQSFLVTITDAAGCTQLLGKNIVVSSLSTPNITAPGSSICMGGSLMLSTSAQNGLTYDWLLNGVVVLGGSTQNTFQITQAGTYKVQVRNALNCTASSNELNIQEAPAPKAEITSSAKVICNGTNVSLVASTVPGAQYEWLRNGVSVQGPTTASTYQAAQPGSYSLRVSLPSGCFNTSLPLQIQQSNSAQSLKLTLSPQRDTLCPGDTLRLGVDGGKNYSWSTGSKAASIQVKPTQNSEYSVEVEDELGCSTTLRKNISIAPLPSAQPTLSEENCQYVLKAGATGGKGPYTYRWSNGSSSSTLPVAQAGTYTLQVSDARKCVSANSASIAVDTFSLWQAPPKSFDPNFENTNGSIELNLRPDRGSEVEWFPNDVGQGENPRTGLSAGTYRAIVMDKQGCMDTVEVTLNKSEDYSNEFVIYPSFTPNDDGVNDYFKIKAKVTGACPSGDLNVCFEDNELIIFNRWGEIVFREQKYNNKWHADGLPAGAYFYLFYPDRSDRKKAVRGALSILK